MSSKFFTNSEGNTLFNKFKGIAQGMPNFHSFLAVVGYFRSSGYFKLRGELHNVQEIKILVGINVDDIFRQHNPACLFLPDGEKAKELYSRDFRKDILDAGYSHEVEAGILQMVEDLCAGRLEMRIHATKNLHAKFYLCLPENHSEHSDGWVIMGSSNISDSGLGIRQPQQYELNVAMKDYDDVQYCSEQFWNLWNEAIPLTADDIASYKAATHLGYQPTPYELYIKVLIDTFGDQVEDDFSIQLPEGVKDLKYQRDAAIQGYQMLMQHGGFFLADVVGLGKTMVAAMIAKRFVEANGRHTSILVVFPPALEANWKSTFRLFGIHAKAQFVSNGSLFKIHERRDGYKAKEEFDLVIVDEAHGFRNASSGRYDELQRICKAPCANEGFLKSTRKKVMLLSATPLNNRPEDLLNQLLLFQDSRSCTIDGVPNLSDLFSPLIKEYEVLMRGRNQRDVTTEVDKIYEQIRSRVIDKVTVRRTRSNILNDPDYRADIESQGVTFPIIQPPNEVVYRMDAQTSIRFYNALKQLTDGKSEANPDGVGLSYARYRAVEHLTPEHREKFKNTLHLGQAWAGIYRVHMVKRLESSFYAFRKSLATLLRITKDMIRMFQENKVIIAPDLNVKDLQAKGMELDEIMEHVIAKGYIREDILFPADAFEPQFLEMLHHDRAILEQLNVEWEKETEDPKFDRFQELLADTFFDTKINPSGKLVLFSESVDTLEYLYSKLTKEIGRTDVLMATAANRERLERTIVENFDANASIQSSDYNILVSTDVLAEGVNLHRANIIVNYDSPWNATRLMQRVGRVNRIGATAPSIYNYMFYPSQQGDGEIQLYKNALLKLQGFHSAFGEDAQVYSREEIVKEFQMFDSTIKDSIDRRVALLRQLRELYASEPGLYEKIKALPMKSRVMRRTGRHSGKSLVFVSSSVKTEFYLVSDETIKAIGFLEALEYLEAQPEEPPVPFPSLQRHYDHVRKAIERYTTEHAGAANAISIARPDLGKTAKEARNFLRSVVRSTVDEELKQQCETLIDYINEGMYARLPSEIRKLRECQDEATQKGKVAALLADYQTIRRTPRSPTESLNPKIIISESFQ